MYSVRRFNIFYLTITGQQFLILHTILFGFCPSVRVFVLFIVSTRFDFDLRVVVSHRWVQLCKKLKIRDHPWRENLCQSLISLMCLKLFVTNPGMSKLFDHFSTLLLLWLCVQFTQVIKKGNQKARRDNFQFYNSIVTGTCNVISPLHNNWYYGMMQNGVITYSHSLQNNHQKIQYFL